MRDIVLSEAFHRLKRTLLVFCAALIVIGLAVPNQTSTLKLVVIDATLSSEIARWLVWGGALYYAVGLAMEVLVICRLNSNAALGNQGKFEAMSAKLSDDVLMHYQAVAKFAEGAPEADFGVSVQLDRLQSVFESQFAVSEIVTSILASQDLPASRFVDEDAVVRAVMARLGPNQGRSIEAFSELKREVQTIKARLNWEPLSEIVGKLDAVRFRLDRAHRDMTRITSSVIIERRLAFWGWEVGAAFAAFAVATLIGLPLQDTFGPVVSWVAHAVPLCHLCR